MELKPEVITYETSDNLPDQTYQFTGSSQAHYNLV